VTRRRALAWAAAGALALTAAGAAAERSASLFALKFRIQRNPELMPSSAAVPEVEIRRGLPTLSLYMTDEALYDPKSGILANKLRHGREWEREGTVSYLDGGRVLFASPAGVRVHGGGSRLISEKQGFRLYFRREYGAATVPPGLLFGPPHEHPLKVLMVHNDVRTRAGVRWALTNPLAFDIAAAVGGITSAAKPVRFVLNGEFQGVYVLYEHFHPKHYFHSHGQRAITLDGREFEALYEQVKALQPLTMANAGALVDLENLTNWFIATAFCATRDAFQGPSQFRDGSRPRAQWFWVNWDMDASFGDVNENSFHTLLIPPGGARRGRRSDEIRPYLLTELLNHDPSYRAYFERAWLEAMNYRLTPAFLRERFEHYRDVAITYGVQPLDYLQQLEAFLRDRPGRLRGMVGDYLHRPTVTVRIRSARPFVVDGHELAADLDGYVFQGMKVSLDIPASARGRFAFWRVNGQPRPLRESGVTVDATSDLDIQAVWR
jgi:hypothetical protein